MATDRLSATGSNGDAEMAEADLERALWIWTAGEVFVMLVLFWLLWGSVFGATGFLSSVPRSLRLAGLVFAVVQLLVPAWVLVDLRRHADDPSLMWVHVTAMPVLNVFGLVGYLEERRLREGE